MVLELPKYVITRSGPVTINWPAGTLRTSWNDFESSQAKNPSFKNQEENSALSPHLFL